MSAPPPSANLLQSSATDPQILRWWAMEHRLGWLHLATGPLALLLIPLAPGVSPLSVGLLALSITLAAIGELALLRRSPTDWRLRAARTLATALEWAPSLVVIALCAATPSAEPTPAVLLILLVLTGARYGRRGLLIAATGAELTIAALAAAEAWLLGRSDPGGAWNAGLSWGVLVGLMALVLESLLPVAERAGRSVPPAPTREVPPPLSPREAEILTLLAQDVPRKENAHRLCITENTVKTHQEHLSEKLGTGSTGRRALVRAAYLRGYIPPPPHPPDNTTDA